MSTATKRVHRIKYLRTLIAEDSGAHDEERDAARRALARLLAKQEEEGTSAGAVYAREFSGGAYGRTYGEKYDYSYRLSLADIAKLIRADIALAQKLGRKLAAGPGEVAVVDPIGTAPKEIKITVKREYYAGGGSIDIFVRHIPEAWGWVMETDQWGQEQKRPSPALRALANELRSISDAYNHNGSDIMTDYFDVRFYGSVMTSGGLVLA